MNMTKTPWSMTRQGDAASKYLLVNDNGMEVELSDFGALILAIRLPVGNSKRDVVLGFDTLEEYYNNAPGFGAYVGRNANRIANAQVTLEGVCYPLEKNDNGHNLHSGEDRSYYKFYKAEQGKEADSVWVEFSRLSPHMENGFPGNLNQKIRYILTNSNELILQYTMVSDKETVINPTNHCYFNLAGEGTGSILTHKMEVYADFFLPTDATLIPTGEERSVEGTPFDFRTSHTIGERIDQDYEPLNFAGGYDHNFCYPNDGRMKKMAYMESPDGLVSMTTSSDLCGIQIYSGNFLAGEKGKGGAVYNRRNGICFETQFYPNACNTPSFASTVYKAGQVFESKTCYRFGF